MELFQNFSLFHSLMHAIVMIQFYYQAGSQETQRIPRLPCLYLWSHLDKIHMAIVVISTMSIMFKSFRVLTNNISNISAFIVTG